MDSTLVAMAVSATHDQHLAGLGGVTPVDELFRQWHRHRDPRAREELVRCHLGLARKLALRYAGTPEPFDDLYQVACLGLLKAIDRFDPARGVAFSSFAIPTILGELKRHFRDKGWSVHLPRALQELVLKVQNARSTLGARTGRSPTVAEVAQYLELDTEQVLEALEALGAHHASSLDAEIDAGVEDGSNTAYDTVGVEDDRYGLVETSASLQAAVERLAETDQRVFALRFVRGLKQSEIAAELGVSQMQVSRILRRIIDELRADIGLEAQLAPTRRRRRSAASQDDH
jgi:RNA polymerase sigma-B factor